MIIKVNGSTKNLPDDDVNLDSILSASDEEISAQEKDFFTNPDVEAQNLKTRLEQIGRAYAAGAASAEKKEENFLNEFSRLFFVFSEQVQSANQQNMRSLSDQITQAMDRNENCVYTISDCLKKQLHDVYSDLHAQISSLESQIQRSSNNFVALPNIDQTNLLKNEFTDVFHQANRVNSAIEDMQMRSDRLRVSLKLQSEELLNSLHQIMHQLAATGDGLSDTVEEVLREKATANLKKFA